MKNLMILQEGLLTDDKGLVNSYMEELDIKTANDEMTKAGEKFGFKTIKVHGKVLGWMAEISRVLGYGDQHSYRRLLERWEVEMPNIGWYGTEYRTRIRETLGINEKDSRALLVDWTGFLIGGVKGEGSNADEVLSYLLKREREARIYSATVDQVKAEKHAMDKELHEIKVLKERISLCRAASVKIPERLRQAFKTQTGADLPIDTQSDIFEGK